MKIFFVFAVFLVFSSVFALGCEVSESTTDATSTDDADANIIGDTRNVDTAGLSDAPVALHYFFLRINDRSTNTDGQNPGADIDAVSIFKSGTEERVYATRVEEYKPINEADISTASIIPDNILGPPTAFGTPFDPANAGADKDCDLSDEHFVSLGGMGGYIILSFGTAHVENGDIINVYEIGNCNGEGQTDPIEVQVSVASHVDGNWETVFSAAAGPVMSAAVSNLPVVF